MSAERAWAIADAMAEALTFMFVMSGVGFVLLFIWSTLFPDGKVMDLLFGDLTLRKLITGRDPLVDGPATENFDD